MTRLQVDETGIPDMPDKVVKVSGFETAMFFIYRGAGGFRATQLRPTADKEHRSFGT